MFFSSQLYLDDLKATAEILKDNGVDGKSFLITGASGLIGSYLVDALVYHARFNGAKNRIYALGRSEAKLKERFAYADGEVNLVSADICAELDDSVNYDYIIHAASNADPGTYARYPVETIQTNILGTHNCLKYAHSHPGTRMLLTSTMEVYGAMDKNGAIQEDEAGVVDFNTVRAGYPESKRVSELLVRSYAEEYGTDALIARLGYIYGPTMTKADNKAVAQFIRSMIEKKDIVLKSEGLQNRSYCYVADTVNAILFVLFKGEKAQAYNVANELSTTTIANLAKTAASIAGAKVIFDLPTELEKKGFSPTRDAVLSENKLKALGWQGQYTLAEGLSRTAQILNSKT